MKRILLLFLISFSFLPIVAIAQQRPPNDTRLPKDDVPYPVTILKHIPPSVVDEIIIMDPDPAKMQRLRESLQTIAERYPNASRTIDTVRIACNFEDVFKLKGELIKYFMEYQSERVGSANRPHVRTMDEEDSLGFSPNYIIKHPKEAVFLSFLKFLQTPNYKKHVIEQVSGSGGFKIAVLDSGLDTDIVKGFTGVVSQPCMPGVNETGWNYIHNSQNIMDDSEEKHGTLVTRLIIDEFQKLNPAARIQIIPVKVVDKEGIGDLFSMLSGIAYAIENNAKVINASLGFYSIYPNPVQVQKLITKLLTGKDLVMIAAAGNSNKDADKVATDNGVQRSNLRNLEHNHFYPAGFSSSVPNIYGVTTAHKTDNKISPNQNYSKTLVNIGVRGDKRYCFKSPYPACLKKNIKGSSFAAPIFAGKVAAFMAANPGTSTTGIVDLLRTSNWANIVHSAGLTNWVKDGNSSNKSQ